LTDKVPRGNGTICQVLGFKLKENAQRYKCKNYYGKKVWTVSATDVEWVECEHVNKTSLLIQLESLPQMITNQRKKQSNPSLMTQTIILTKELISCRFKLEPEQFSPEVTVKHYHTSSMKAVF